MLLIFHLCQFWKELKSGRSKRSASHTEDLTSSPYKRRLEATPANKKRAVKRKLPLPSPEPRKKKSSITDRSDKPKRCQSKTSTKKTAGSSNSCTRGKQLNDSEEDTATACGHCGIFFGDKKDKRNAEN
jgi:hypothetical protein